MTFSGGTCPTCGQTLFKKAGRGAYGCPDPACLKKAAKSRALERTFETAIPDEVYALLEKQMEEEHAE